MKKLHSLFTKIILFFVCCFVLGFTSISALEAAPSYFVTAQRDEPEGVYKDGIFNYNIAFTYLGSREEALFFIELNENAEYAGYEFVNSTFNGVDQEDPVKSIHKSGNLVVFLLKAPSGQTVNFNMKTKAVGAVGAEINGDAGLFLAGTDWEFWEQIMSDIKDRNPGQWENITPQGKAKWFGAYYPIEPVPIIAPKAQDIVEPKTSLTISDKDEVNAQSCTLSNRGEGFIYKVEYAFGNGAENWETVSLVDNLNNQFIGSMPLSDLINLDPASFKLVDGDGNDVSGKGQWNFDGTNVNFVLNKENGSYSYLNSKTYYLSIEGHIKDTITNQDLKALFSQYPVLNKASLAVLIGSDNVEYLTNEVSLNVNVIEEEQPPIEEKKETPTDNNAVGNITEETREKETYLPATGNQSVFLLSVFIIILGSLCFRLRKNVK